MHQQAGQTDVHMPGPENLPGGSEAHPKQQPANKQ